MSTVQKCQVIIAANRLPYEIIVHEDGTGEVVECVSGLVTALQSISSSHFKEIYDALWVGGMVETYRKYEESLHSHSEKYNLRIEWIPENYHKQHRGWCNEKLWLLFHELDPEEELAYREETRMWEGYKRVNEYFAETIRKYANTKHPSPPVIWIQDYHLLLAPELVRQTPEIRIGFFLHIPFPKPKNLGKLFLFQVVDILHGMLGSNVIGFHTKEFCQNFLESCQRFLNCPVNFKSMTVHYKGREVLVRAIPAGISFKTVSSNSTGDLSQECPIKGIFEANEDKKIIIGADRIDYTKGLFHKTQAFHELLKTYPELDGKIVYIQIAVPCRSEDLSFQRLQSKLTCHVEDINEQLRENRKSSLIEMVYEKVSPKDLAVLFSKACVALVTPLKDGLNLVAMEYVASQSLSTPGVLILSKFAGAAEILPGALKVDPYDKEEIVSALYHALNMSKDERDKRMVNLQEAVRTNSADRYITENINTIQQS